MVRYKLWLQLERIDDEHDTYENVEEPLCIGDFGAYPLAIRQLRALATIFDPISNVDYAYPVEMGDEDGNEEDV